MPFTAIVAGGSGLTGGAIVEHLAQNPQTWSLIHSVTRSRTKDYPSHIKQHTLDLLNATPDDIAQALAKDKIIVDYVFFAALSYDEDQQKMYDDNVKMLDSLLSALNKSQPDHKIRRVVLTTGAKYYGVHLGPVRLPCNESDPRVHGPIPNYYYPQEDILARHCKSSGWEWNVCRPNVVQGVSPGNFVNLAVTVALYASVQKELGDSLWFPGNSRLYRGWDDQSYAPLVAEFEEWVALHPDTANEAFNIVNGDNCTWSRAWPFISDYFGVPIPKDNFSAPPPLPMTIQLPFSAPVAQVANDLGLPTDEPHGLVESRLSFAIWSQLPKVKEAWDSLVKKHGLNPEAFSHGTWLYAGLAISRDWDVVLSMSKARKYGWKGYKESTDAFREIFERLEKEHIIPPKTGTT